MSEHDDSQAVPPAAALAADEPFLNRAAWARILPFGTYLFFIVLADVLERSGYSRAELRWLYPVQVGAVLALLVAFWRGYDELHRFALSLRQVLAAGAAGIVVLVLWVNLDASWMTIGSAPGYDPRTHGEIDWLLASIRIAGAALIVPVMEELFWRSFLLRWVEQSDFMSLDPARIGFRAFMIPCLLFGFEHHLWLAGVIAGAAYGLLYMRHRKLWSPILAHAITNGLLGVWVVHTGGWQFW
ncbi:CAAX prenyl protease-related protein [Massilia sp. CFBP9012]|uniref:CAAX prenyl protease-related protein n=1 Tax=Massilia sp. CFBP9012 TaxID=3096531 RepID=UPI002A69A906|nr:CAAX prenyl protease-related protein [Massilia sp. CFBP9012]MDY0976382.1 CAAX prenyl protease-related protein [Massilia sp. CFBP9012]